MEKVIPIDEKTMSKANKAAVLFFSIATIILAFYIKSPYPAFVGLILFIILILDKKVEITEEGIKTTLDMKLFKHEDLWSFDDIQEIHKELSPDCTRYALHFLKDIMSKRIVVYSGDVQQVIELAQKRNPSIRVSNVD